MAIDLKFNIPDKQKKAVVEERPTVRDALDFQKLKDELERIQLTFAEILPILEKLHEDLRTTNVNIFPVKQVTKSRWQDTVNSVLQTLKLVN